MLFGTAQLLVLLLAAVGHHQGFLCPGCQAFIAFLMPTWVCKNNTLQCGGVCFDPTLGAMLASGCFCCGYRCPPKAGGAVNEEAQGLARGRSGSSTP